MFGVDVTKVQRADQPSGAAEGLDLAPQRKPDYRKIAARLETLRCAVASRVEIKEVAILRNANSAMMTDPRLILTPEGQFLPVDRWPEEIASAVDTFEVTELSGAAGHVSKVTFSSRTAAREQLMKYTGPFAKDNARRSDGLTAKLDCMTDEALAAMEENLESILHDSDEDDI